MLGLSNWIVLSLLIFKGDRTASFQLSHGTTRRLSCSKRKSTTFLYSSSTVPTEGSEALSRQHEGSGREQSFRATLAGNNMPPTELEERFPKHTNQQVADRLSMPWSNNQDWALRDNLPRYTIVIPLDADTNPKAPFVFALWRTMLKEVPELAGYPIGFLQEMNFNQIAKNETRMHATPQLLPYLEDYSFTTGGGVSGKAYGIPGLADGTTIETSAVSNIEVTLPQGFVRTSDGKAAYELGRPHREDITDGVNRKFQKPMDSIGSAGAGSYELLKTINRAEPGTVEDADGMLLRLGASTGILLAGAMAINMLSHHLTVNVFWV